MPISSIPPLETISRGGAVRSLTSISTIRSSRSPARSWARSFSRVSRKLVSSSSGASGRVFGGGGRRMSSSFSSTAARAFSRISATFSCLTMSTEMRTRSRIDRFDVAADVADLGELAGLDLEEGRGGQLGQAAGDLGLADAGRADHEDVLGRDLVGQVGRQRWRRRKRLRRAMATAFLAALLADDVLVELGDDLPGRQLDLGHARPLGRSSASGRTIGI